ncbi:MAG: polysaccharide biosynthesis tyrosine autokinase [Acidimicrobiia bacterium]|nr:polysaccharide biosynthesis tyrosine autokinase [Acidimicrobiia bacterium]MDH5289514.1 polysaccharide biosynthesis tyrosine autokinase [Acidimicrobiia bacterium]
MVSSSGALADELELADYLRIMRRRWLWILVPAVAVCTLATAVTATRSPTWSASAQVSVGGSAAQEAISGGASGAAGVRELSNEVDLALSDQVRQEVASRLGFTPDVDIAAAESSDAILFTATAPTAEAAATAANTWADVYVETKRQDAIDSIDGAVEAFQADLADFRAERMEIRKPIDDLDDQLAGDITEEERSVLEGQLARLENDLEPDLNVVDAKVEAVAASIAELQLNSRLAAAGAARVVQVAAPPQHPTNASMERNLLLGLVIGLILGAAVALLVENLDRTIKGPDDVAALGLPLLGGIPEPGRPLDDGDLALATLRHPRSPVAEAYQKVRTAVEFALLGREINSLLITSPDQGEGKTTSAANLAWAMSAVDHRVALIDVDFRRPRIHRIFECPLEPGLSDNLRSGVPLDKLAVRVGTPGSRNLVVIPTGALPPNPGEFVASPAFAAVIRDLEQQADLVILDAPPVGPVSDAVSIGRIVDAVIVVARSGRTTRDQLRETVDSLRQVGADVIGVCLVGVASSEYGSYYGKDRDRDSTRPPRSLETGRPGVDLTSPPATSGATLLSPRRRPSRPSPNGR